MSEERRFPRGDEPYLEWHRTASIRRYLPEHEAYALAMIDLDSIEYCRVCNEPLALVELARDTGQDHKATTVLQRTVESMRAGGSEAIGILVLYTVDGEEISALRVKQVAPKYRLHFITFTPAEWARQLHDLRIRHACPRRLKHAA